MMARYHVNPSTGNAGVCKATRNCPFGDLEKDHYASKDEARLAYEAKQASVFRGQRKPIILESAKGEPADRWTFDFHSLIAATDADEWDYYSSSYSDPTWVDAHKAVEIITGIARNEWPESLQKVVEENEKRWGDASEWELENGYYETDSPTLYTPAGLETTLKDWYYAQPNAEDANGILRHVREKGYDTTGLDPAGAVKKMLREENGKILRYVEASYTVSKSTLDFSKITYSKTHYEKIDPAEPLPQNPESDEIIGVVKYQNGKYRLLDGHHRMKWASQAGRGKGHFIIL